MYNKYSFLLQWCRVSFSMKSTNLWIRDEEAPYDIVDEKYHHLNSSNLQNPLSHTRLYNRSAIEASGMCSSDGDTLDWICIRMVSVMFPVLLIAIRRILEARLDPYYWH